MASGDESLSSPYTGSYIYPSRWTTRRGLRSRSNVGRGHGSRYFDRPIPTFFSPLLEFRLRRASPPRLPVLPLELRMRDGVRRHHRAASLLRANHLSGIATIPGGDPLPLRSHAARSR